VEEYLGIALVAHDLPAAAEDPEMPLETLLALARADDSDRVVQLEASIAMREPTTKRPRWPLRWSFAASMAAAVLLLAASAVWWVRDGELLGSVLHLNTDSAVTVRFTRKERVIEIARGQAFFTVAPGDVRRFRVTAGNVHVIAVGTRFEGYRKSDATIVTVMEGSVAVISGRPPPQNLKGMPAGAPVVNAGFQVRVDARGVLAQPIQVNTQQAAAWLQQKIAFEQRPLGEVADEFNRYGSTPIEIDDAALRALPITGVFDAHDIDSFVAFLQTLDGVRVVRTPTRIRVSSVKFGED
jgi:transmembrane sensor